MDYRGVPIPGNASPAGHGPRTLTLSSYRRPIPIHPPAGGHVGVHDAVVSGWHRHVPVFPHSRGRMCV